MSAFGQQADSTASAVKQKRAKSPQTAGLLSLIPGGGQVYNGKYWKVPIVYAAIGGSGYVVYYFHDKYMYYRTEYRLRLNGETEGLRPELSSMSTYNVKDYKDYYQRNQELGAFVFILCYALNILDAVVDAHFSNFDISDDLSLNIQPCAMDLRMPYAQGTPSLGVSFVLQLK